MSDTGRAAVRAFLAKLRGPALRKWLESGGHVLERASSHAQLEAYREAFVLVLSALALDAQNSALTDSIRMRNAGPLRGSGRPSEARRRPKAIEDDDYTDGSELQAGLVEANVRPGKAEVFLGAAVHDIPGSDGRPSRRVVADGFASEPECQLVVAGALLGFAGGFVRNGQSTLGISPALAVRLAPAAAAEGEQSAGAMRALYALVERARRRVASDFGVECELYVSDAQVARLQPVDEAATAAGARTAEFSAGHDPWDVGLARADHFSYWRPHIDQVSVRSYDYSALLYLTEHSADFEGGRLVLHDADVERVVLPRAGRLVLFPSGAGSLHAVERVTSGTRFALTMWFTRSARDRQPDPEQRAWLAWARACADLAAQARAEGAPLPQPPAAPESAPAAGKPPLPSRLDGLRLSALCTLPAGDPLCRDLLGALEHGSASVELALATGVGYDPTAIADWHSLRLEPRALAEPPGAGPAPQQPPSAARARMAPEQRLHPRIEACAALLTALAGSTARAGRDDARGAASGPRGDGSGAPLVHGGSGDAPSKKPRPVGVEDAFSVFD